MDRKMCPKCFYNKNDRTLKLFTRNSSITIMKMNLGDKEECKIKWWQQKVSNCRRGTGMRKAKGLEKYKYKDGKDTSSLNQ